jgi:hypothetical protein
LFEKDFRGAGTWNYPWANDDLSRGQSSRSESCRASRKGTGHSTRASRHGCVSPD